jgi:putative transposase
LQNYSAAREAGRSVGFPRFRAKGRGHEAVIFQRPRLADNRHVMLDRRLGPLYTKESMRKLARLLDSDPHARVMRSTVQRVNGGWVISFTVQRSAKQRRARRPNAIVGVDLGLTHLATLSTGHVAANSRPSRRRCAHYAGCSASSTGSAARTIRTTTIRVAGRRRAAPRG